MKQCQIFALYLPAPLPKPIDEYMSSIVLLRGTLPVDLKVTSSVFTVRGGPSVAGVLGEEACEDEGEALFVGGIGTEVGLLLGFDGCD